MTSTSHETSAALEPVDTAQHDLAEAGTAPLDTAAAATPLQGESPLTPEASPVPPPEPMCPTAAEPKLSRQARLHAELQAVQPVLQKLFELYPQLFGAAFLPLKLGVYQDLMARHPDVFTKDTLKLALGQHTRSSRYLQSVAALLLRHDLDGQPVQPVAPEHVYLTMLELFRRRQRHAREDLRPKFRAQLIAAFEASGLSRQDYIAKVQTSDEHATALLQEALAEHAEKLARTEALMTLFDSSGKTPDEFADMYGMDKREIARALTRRHRAS